MNIAGTEKKLPPEKSVMEYGLLLLGTKAFSTALFRKKLLAKGYGKRETEELITLLTERGYLNDLLYGESLCRSLRESARGTLWIRRKLHLAGLSRELTDRILEEESRRGAVHSPFDLEEESGEEEEQDVELAAALKALRSKWRTLSRETDPGKKREKVLRFLAGRGFSSSSAYGALDKLLHSQEE